MIPDTTNQLRPILENAPPAFFDRVNTPWDQVPDLEDYNKHAYLRIVRALKDLTRSTPEQTGSNTQGVLILGEAGTGKTHLLMRVARNLAETNHILFIRKPNNEDAVAQHIWVNVVNSLAKTIPTKTSVRSQLDDLLAHVFSNVLIPEFEQDIREDKDADQKRRWVVRLQDDPYNLFNMLGEGERRHDNLDRIRRRTLRFLQLNHPDVDQTIAHVLITYCFVVREDRKRVLLTWLAGQDVEESEAKDLGLPPSWVTLDETSSDASTQQQREEQALRAIRTVGILSTYYQPLILAFDQLEGLRDQTRLTHKWGDAVREIFTMAPNFLVITCIFPSLWETWFLPTLDQSVSERMAQQVVTLETFGPQHGLKLLATHLESSFIKHRLPTNIYPFATQDVQLLCRKATSPRSFIQAARHEFQSWLDGSLDSTVGVPGDATEPVSQAEIDDVIKRALARFEEALRKSFGSEMVLEQDFFGRIRSLTETLLFASGSGAELAKATSGHFVMPPNFVIRHAATKTSLCLAVMNSEGSSFAARMRNLNKCLKDGHQFTHLIMIRDRRCKRLGAKSQEHLEEAQAKGASYVQAGQDEMTCINAVYDTLVAVEEHDLTVGEHEIDKRQIVGFLRNERVLSRTEFFRHAGRHYPPLAEVVGVEGPQSRSVSDPPLAPTIPHQVIPPQRPPSKPPQSSPEKSPAPPIPPKKSMVEIVIGDDVLDSPHVGVLGELRDGRKKLGISLTKPQCLVLLGYMGSGKSYALGVLIENALLTQPGLIEQTRPMCVVAFNYRRNPHSRFEHGGFAVPNSEPGEVERLAQKYGGQPTPVETVNVFAYQEELPRRASEYGSLKTFPIQFRPDELGAEHWEILMKPPTREAEYMDIIRDIIQKLFYQERLTFKNLERAIQTDERMSNSQRRRAMNRLSFAERWISDDRPYEWADVLQEGTLNIFDLRMQAMEASEALKLCLIITDLVRRTKNGVNKMVVFDEAHEYVDCKELVGELENAITQIRHDGLSFVLASQFPERIPERIFKYLLTRLIFKLPNAKAINYVRRSAPNLESLSPQKVSNLDLEQGVCFVQTDDDCTDNLMRVPQALEVRPRCTMHGGSTIRQVGEEEEAEEASTAGASEAGAEPEFEVEEFEAELCPVCGDELVLKRSRSGTLMVCNTYPQCKYARRV
jgi:hypothetical protein